MLANAALGRYFQGMTLRYFNSPVGRLALEAEGEALTGLRWADAGERGREVRDCPVLREASRQLERYFRGKLRRFDLKLAARGTPFQKRVWKLMRAIPFGEIGTYGGIAAALGSGPRAVGLACARNPIPIIVPCHRVLSSDGKIGGYTGGEGLPTKRKLLAIEGVLVS